MTFVRNNMDQIAKKITDDLWVLGAMEVNQTSTPVSLLPRMGNLSFPCVLTEYEFTLMRSYFSDGTLNKSKCCARGSPIGSTRLSIRTSALALHTLLR